MTKKYTDFTNKFQHSKTLRFELKPVGKTQETVEKWLEEIEKDAAVPDGNLLAQDRHRAESYKQARNYINRKNMRIKLRLKSISTQNILAMEYLPVYQW